MLNRSKKNIGFLTFLKISRLVQNSHTAYQKIYLWGRQLVLDTLDLILSPNSKYMCLNSTLKIWDWNREILGLQKLFIEIIFFIFSTTRFNSLKFFYVWAFYCFRKICLHFDNFERTLNSGGYEGRSDRGPLFFTHFI